MNPLAATRGEMPHLRLPHPQQQATRTFRVQGSFKLQNRRYHMTFISMELTIFEVCLGTIAEHNWKQKTGEVRPAQYRYRCRYIKGTYNQVVNGQSNRPGLIALSGLQKQNKAEQKPQNNTALAQIIQYRWRFLPPAQRRRRKEGAGATKDKILFTWIRDMRYIAKLAEQQRLIAESRLLVDLDLCIIIHILQLRSWKHSGAGIVKRRPLRCSYQR